MRNPLWLERCKYPEHRALTEKVGCLEEGFPWRHGVGRAFRIPFTRTGVAIGRWTGEQPRENDEDGPRLSFRAMDWKEVLNETADRPTQG